MALLQISEPGQAPDPHARKWAVGIDLGTTHSLVAAVRSGVAECLPDEAGRVLLPSVVRYLKNGYSEIGYAAQAAQIEDAANTIASVKRLMGRGLQDVDTNQGYEWVSEGGMVKIQTVAGVKSPVDVSAEILATLRQRAEDTVDDDIFGAVITVPAYFDDAQRQATKDAAALAGINVLRLLNEPTAAALAYGLDNALEGVYAVYDLGGGTFDISILRLTQGVFEVVAVGGNSALGGDDFDATIADWALEKLEQAATHNAKISRRALQVAARAAKESLSSAQSASLKIAEQNLVLSRDEFEKITQHLIEKTMLACRKALRDAGFQPSEIKGVVMVGGSTRMPCVQNAVAHFFGTQPLTNLNPDEVVALGAAMQANLLVGNKNSGDDWLLLDVIPLSLGVETMGGLVEKIIPRNSPIPCAMAQDFTTFKDGQTALALHVVQGERELVSDCRSLARFELRGFPPMVAGAARIRVTYTVDADGILTVSALEQTSGVAASINVKPSYGLSDGEITRMLEDSFKSAEIDMTARALAEEKVEAERTLLAVQAALQADAHLLSADELEKINHTCQNLRVHLTSTDHRAIKAATDELAQSTDDFAARRMDAGIKRALSGKQISEI